METILEQQRRLHEERERLVKAMVDELVVRSNTVSNFEVIRNVCNCLQIDFLFILQKENNVLSDHKLNHLLQMHSTSTHALRDLYEDKDGSRKAEIQALSGPNEFTEFYERLKGIKEFYKKHPNEISVPLSVEFEELAAHDELNSLVEFTDEEGMGKFLDLHECYDKFINIKGIEKVDYISYLMTFDHLFDIPKERKNADYKRYLEALAEYLHGYIMRIKPLFDVDNELQKVEREFSDDWQLGTFPGWPKDTESAMSASSGAAHLDLNAFSSWEELASLGLDRLKSALMALELKCGGTLEERAQRLFSTKGKAEVDPALMAKKGRNSQKATANKSREVAAIEAQIFRLAELVSEQRSATKENIQRKQARGEGEREDSEGEQSDSDNDDEDPDDVPYNPKNLPLGWDGKPIPYWLYKLHGLNISYHCEICGNYTYKGPKAFQRHFAEWRHAHGMRCLGIPNTAHFANVTQIEDAIACKWEKVDWEMRIICDNNCVIYFQCGTS